MSATIRKAGIDDLPLLESIEVKSFAPSLYDRMSKRQYRHLLTRGNADILLALSSQNEVGCGAAILLYKKNNSFSRFYSLAVIPEYQGKGVGSHLFGAAEKLSKDKCLKGMILEIRADNDILFQRYQKNGYVSYKTIPDYYPDGEACIKMKKLFE